MQGQREVIDLTVRVPNNLRTRALRWTVENLKNDGRQIERDRYGDVAVNWWDLVDEYDADNVDGYVLRNLFTKNINKRVNDALDNMELLRAYPTTRPAIRERRMREYTDAVTDAVEWDRKLRALVYTVDFPDVDEQDRYRKEFDFVLDYV
jgi:hypothetical protein